MRLPSMVGVALMAGVGLVGCAHTNGMAQADDDDVQAATEVREHHRHHHRGGVTQFIAMSLDTLGADDAERPQIEKLQGELSACLAPTRELERKVQLATADGIAAGTIATAKLDETIAQLNTTSIAVEECSVAALNQLHALLSPAERDVVADKVEAHWEIWRQVNDEAEGGSREQGGRLADLSDELNLTTDQVDRMSSALTAAFTLSNRLEATKGEAYVQAFVAAFVLPAFDARTLMPEARGRFTAHGARRTAMFYETVTPFLTPPQRGELADLVRAHANHPAALSAN